MTTLDTGTFVRRFLADYRRNPVNLVVLVLVPVVFVLVAAGPMADAAKLLGGLGVAVETATAGWAAGFLAGIAMYFQTRAARAGWCWPACPPPGLFPPGCSPGWCWRVWRRLRHCSRSRCAPESTRRAGSSPAPRCSP